MILLLLSSQSVYSYQSLSVETGIGYSGNLFADSFAVGDTYLMTAVSLSTTEFKTTKLYLFYGLSYYNYIDRNSINRMDHLAGLSIFRKNIGDRLKWSLNAYGNYRDYTDENTVYDNYRMTINSNLAYYPVSLLQLKLFLQARISSYLDISDLDHKEYYGQAEIIKTFPTKTTLRARAQYAYRQFDVDQKSVDWVNLNIKLSQSIGIWTGLSLSGNVRLAGNGTRPLSSYTYISGITPYWDPWDGFNLKFALKRIFPWGIIATANVDYWKREYDYSQTQQDEFYWLSGQDGRQEDGWDLILTSKRQFNIFGKIGPTLILHFNTGYISNKSDDPYYNYDYLFTQLSLKYNIF